MTKKLRKPFEFSKKQALISSVIVSLVLNAILMMGIFYGQSKDFLAHIHASWAGYLYYFLWHFCCNVLLFFMLFVYNFHIIKSRKRHIRKNILISVGSLAICILLSPLLSQIQWFMLGGGPIVSMNGFIVFNLVKDIITTVIIIIITANLYLNHQREQTLLVNQKLVQENIRIRYEALKSQLDPHFLFNSLNTLNGLIGIDDEKAHEYIDNLSSVFRYTLHSKTIGTLTEEREYVDAYIALLSIRYGDNMQVVYDVDSRYGEYHIMPASLQLLVENAVKHNVISNRSNLVINIRTTDRDSIVVSNRINPKSDKSIGGIGLANLVDRYSLLFGKQVAITNAEGVFSVEIPLLKELDKNMNI